MAEALDTYLRVREKEGRLYPDDVARNRPLVPEGHPLRDEWQARAASCRRLTTYLARLAPKAGVLELGCGNGWLSYRIARSTSAPVVGLDRRQTELVQAQRVFQSCRNLSWLVTDIFSSPFRSGSFDVIVLASSIQYFEDLPALVGALVPLLKRKGEIHVLDSQFYAEHTVQAAKERSQRYYDELGFPEMSRLYHHHSATALKNYNPAWLYVPKPREDRVASDSPFPWVCLRPDGAR